MMSWTLPQSRPGSAPSKASDERQSGPSSSHRPSTASAGRRESKVHLGVETYDDAILTGRDHRRRSQPVAPPPLRGIARNWGSRIERVKRRLSSEPLRKHSTTSGSQNSPVEDEGEKEGSDERHVTALHNINSTPSAEIDQYLRSLSKSKLEKIGRSASQRNTSPHVKHKYRRPNRSTIRWQSQRGAAVSQLSLTDDGTRQAKMGSLQRADQDMEAMLHSYYGRYVDALSHSPNDRNSLYYEFLNLFLASDEEELAKEESNTDDSRSRMRNTTRDSDIQNIVQEDTLIGPDLFSSDREYGSLVKPQKYGTPAGRDITGALDIQTTSEDASGSFMPPYTSFDATRRMKTRNRDYLREGLYIPKDDDISIDEASRAWALRVNLGRGTGATEKTDISAPSNGTLILACVLYRRGLADSVEEAKAILEHPACRDTAHQAANIDLTSSVFDSLIEQTFENLREALVNASFKPAKENRAPGKKQSRVEGRRGSVHVSNEHAAAIQDKPILEARRHSSRRVRSNSFDEAALSSRHNIFEAKDKSDSTERPKGSDSGDYSAWKFLGSIKKSRNQLLEKRRSPEKPSQIEHTSSTSSLSSDSFQDVTVHELQSREDWNKFFHGTDLTDDYGEDKHEETLFSRSDDYTGSRRAAAVTIPSVRSGTSLSRISESERESRGEGSPDANRKRGTKHHHPEWSKRLDGANSPAQSHESRRKPAERDTASHEEFGTTSKHTTSDTGGTRHVYSSYRERLNIPKSPAKEAELSPISITGEQLQHGNSEIRREGSYSSRIAGVSNRNQGGATGEDSAVLELQQAMEQAHLIRHSPRSSSEMVTASSVPVAGWEGEKLHLLTGQTRFFVSIKSSRAICGLTSTPWLTMDSGMNTVSWVELSRWYKIRAWCRRQWILLLLQTSMESVLQEDSTEPNMCFVKCLSFAHEMLLLHCQVYFRSLSIQELVNHLRIWCSLSNQSLDREAEFLVKTLTSDELVEKSKEWNLSVLCKSVLSSCSPKILTELKTYKSSHPRICRWMLVVKLLSQCISRILCTDGLTKETLPPRSSAFFAKRDEHAFSCCLTSYNSHWRECKILQGNGNGEGITSLCWTQYAEQTKGSDVFEMLCGQITSKLEEEYSSEILVALDNHKNVVTESKRAEKKSGTLNDAVSIQAWRNFLEHESSWTNGSARQDSPPRMSTTRQQVGGQQHDNVSVVSPRQKHAQLKLNESMARTREDMHAPYSPIQANEERYQNTTTSAEEASPRVAFWSPRLDTSADRNGNTVRGSSVWQSPSRPSPRKLHSPPRSAPDQCRRPTSCHHEAGDKEFPSTKPRVLKPYGDNATNEYMQSTSSNDPSRSYYPENNSRDESRNLGHQFRRIRTPRGKGGSRSVNKSLEDVDAIIAASQEQRRAITAKIRGR
eukprot:gb/GECG01014205.1/.p1 GENE.gb/GECG01014205.1/~~gb/GECG01014205.1/.p1  ORF type:complete len:1400 (+),score=185.50 gb/GECG01014205.1/:1-4200(+)